MFIYNIQILTNIRKVPAVVEYIINNITVIVICFMCIFKGGKWL